MTDTYQFAVWTADESRSASYTAVDEQDALRQARRDDHFRDASDQRLIVERVDASEETEAQPDTDDDTDDHDCPGGGCPVCHARDVEGEVLEPGEIRRMTCQTCGERRWCGRIPDWYGAVCNRCISAEMDYNRQHFTEEELGDTSHVDAMQAALLAAYQL